MFNFSSFRSLGGNPGSVGPVLNGPHTAGNPNPRQAAPPPFSGPGSVGPIYHDPMTLTAGMPLARAGLQPQPEPVGPRSFSALGNPQFSQFFRSLL